MDPINNKKSGINLILIPLLALGVVVTIGYKGFGWENSLKSLEEKEIVRNITEFVTPKPPKHEAWQVFENYLEFARTHNLDGIKSLSHQISATCLDETRTEECFALMDNLYNIASTLRQSDFRYIEEDSRQIIMSTDGPVVAILFFTKDLTGTPKVLGLRFCIESGEVGTEPCVEIDPAKRDLDENGWWDKVESLFYQ